MKPAVSGKYSKVYPISSDDKQFQSSGSKRNKTNKSSSPSKQSPQRKKKKHFDGSDDDTDNDDNNNNRRKYHYEDSDCSSSIHSDDRILQQSKSKAGGGGGDDDFTHPDTDRVIDSSKKGGGAPMTSSKYSVRNREIREAIMMEVLEQVLPTMGDYENDQSKFKPREEDSTLVKWLKLIGCMAMDLHDAVICGSLEQVQKTLKKICVGPNATPELINEYNSEGVTPLSLAAKSNLFEICAELIDHNADVECPDEGTGRTPLFHAVQNRNHDLIFMLWKHGANANVADVQCITPLMIAASTDDYKTVKMLCTGHADVDVQDERGWTALHYAVYANAVKSVKILIQEGADRDLKDMNGRKPLKFAQYHEYGECISILDDKNSTLA